jgi:hypothetical protein
MPATFTTREVYPMSTEDGALKTEIDLRIGAGAIRSRVEVQDGHKVLITEWNIIGSND